MPKRNKTVGIDFTSLDRFCQWDTGKNIFFSNSAQIIHCLTEQDDGEKKSEIRYVLAWISKPLNLSFRVSFLHQPIRNDFSNIMSFLIGQKKT